VETWQKSHWSVLRIWLADLPGALVPLWQLEHVTVVSAWLNVAGRSGLAPESRETAFAAGQRLDDLTPGTGLGLAISRDLTRIYGGDVALSEADGGGLRATVLMREATRPD
jgi:C4-dicarboxylate-specific signal transduction histidine kinase